jgi:UDP-N-acetylglucosamine 2-epimerase (non-hydrolysing)
MRQLKLLIIAGARPNFMKIAPLIRAAEAYNGLGDRQTLDWRLVHTGQHYDSAMSDIFFSELGIPAPHINLEVGSGTQAVQTANVMKEFEPVCLSERPDWIVVVGDVNSTVACALVASKLGIKVAHVEAGLRSFDRSMPEEINRLVTDTLADLLFTPSRNADENLIREGIDPDKIELVGNIMIDAVIANLEKARASAALQTNGISKEKFVYVTLHRPSNVDDPLSLASIMSELTRLAADMPVVFPMHPRTRKMCAQFGISCDGIRGLKVLDPIGYHDSLSLVENARFVLTDSGGLQEETTFFRTPCLTLRPNTERPITISLGSNRLTTIETLSSDIENVLCGPARFGQIPPLWDGHTARRIVDTFVGRNNTANSKHKAKTQQAVSC